MSRYDDALFAAAERHWGPALPSGVTTCGIERPVPHVGEPLDGWREFAVRVELSEGAVLSAEVYAELEPYRTSAQGLRWREVPCVGGPVTLDAQESENVAVRFAEEEAES